jgi:hypothetical protein
MGYIVAATCVKGVTALGHGDPRARRGMKSIGSEMTDEGRNLNLSLQLTDGKTKSRQPEGS